MSKVQKGPDTGGKEESTPWNYLEVCGERGHGGRGLQKEKAVKLGAKEEQAWEVANSQVRP